LIDVSRVVIVGGSIAGLTLALALADRGVDTVVFEQDSIADKLSPDETRHGSGHRRSTPQDRHSHTVMPLGRSLLASHLPQVLTELLEAGAAEVPMVDHLPTAIADRQPRAGDEELVGLACRRTVFESVVRQAAASHPRVDLRTGVTVDSLHTRPGDPPRVVGVVVDGVAVGADVVVDAGGRNSPVARWLTDAGVTLPDAIVESCGVVYFSRFYRRLRPLDLSLNRGLAAGVFGSVSAAVCFPADNGTTSTTLGVLPGDQLARALAKPAGFTVAARLHPMVGAWLDPSAAEPISDVAVMTRLNNRMQRLAADGEPRVHGLVAAGDATCTTNPAFGRGVSLAMAHAFALVQAITTHAGDVEKLALDVDRIADEVLQPWFEDSVVQDRARTARWRNQAVPPPLAGRDLDRVMRVAPMDADVWRAAMRRYSLIDPPNAIFENTSIMAKVADAERRAPATPAPVGPTRAELVAALS
jgi:2-polyprenyl-6-methoxyphenol hydroxylase-like FAD-dependent oxidoreductase